ncbi:sushi, von Willebrand factor type A, EGF and pentraxin domain-containing protein 1-like [Stylophora pistillata]|uniref:sushi, von Willebrand factor type A, EGF and pentraxin domain-containing protein 1-like n=1 Tax=Stylophora pistillata TaxID=50429 RepID=UPI000C04BE0E|nr:sushi, von Willebrand factor type A, EGF and pentraxin domain-containing protein 1-like [Stylophora pistillata]
MRYTELINMRHNELIAENYRRFNISIAGANSGELGSANDGIWHYICFTWQSSNGTVMFHKDGSLEQSSGLLGTGGSLVLGQEQDSLEKALIVLKRSKATWQT